LGFDAITGLCGSTTYRRTISAAIRSAFARIV
jgi:hypothetical protein